MRRRVERTVIAVLCASFVWTAVGCSTMAGPKRAGRSASDKEKLLECIKKNSGLVYAMFETSVFHNDLYAMEKLYAADVFGHVVYSEGEYCHPHTLGAPSIGSYKDWRKNGTPMWYPTHATAYYVGVTHGHLSNDFIDAILRGRKPAVDVIDALNMTVPGYYAHLSAVKDGERIKIPQYSL